MSSRIISLPATFCFFFQRDGHSWARLTVIATPCRFVLDHNALIRRCCQSISVVVIDTSTSHTHHTRPNQFFFPEHDEHLYSLLEVRMHTEPLTFVFGRV
jgi:hypothetical protein